MLVHVPSSQFRILLISCSVIPGWVCGSPATAAVPVPPSAQSQSQAVENYGKLPIGFEANQGQADPNVKFLSRGNGYAIYLTGNGAVLALGQSGGKPADCSPSAPGKKLPDTTHATPCPAESNAGRDIIRMTLAGAPGQLGAAHASGEDQLPGKVNYFLGNDPTRWRTDLPTYSKVRYSSVYPGIDLVYYGNQRQLEYDFVVAPGASTTSIQLNFAGARHLRIAANGDLVLQGAHGEANFRKPVLYQEVVGERQSVDGKFRIVSRNTVGFSVANYDHNRALIIDPILVYSTYLGGSGSDEGNGIAVDSAGNAYVVGATTSTDFPVTSGAYQPSNKAAQNGAKNVFVSKFNASGTALIYSTYLGGNGAGAGPSLPPGDTGAAIAIDSENNAYVTGWTESLDFPVTAGAFQTVNNNNYNNGLEWALPTAFVTKLNAKGDGLAYSTYLGGSNDGFGSSIAIDDSGDAFVAGYTNATDFPVTAGAFQTQYPGTGSGDTPSAFVSKLNPQGTNLVYSTYLGGTGIAVLGYGVTYTFTTYYGDSANGIALDSLGNAYVAGQTYSADFPVTSGAFQTVNKGYPNNHSTAFVTELNATGTAEIYSTYLGGSGVDSTNPDASGGDSANAIALDGTGNAYVAGTTWSADFPVTAGAVQGSLAIDLIHYCCTLSNGFVTKVNEAGSGLEYSTFLAGADAQASGLAVDNSGFAYVSGNAPYFPETPDALTQNGGVFVAKLNALGTALDYATSLGGDPGSNPISIARDSAGNLYVAGSDYSSGYLISSGAYQTVNKSSGPYGTNAFVTKLALAGETVDHFPVTVSLSASAATVNQGQPLTLTATVAGPSSVPTPTGQVTFADPYAFRLSFPGLPVVETLDGGGVATWTSSTLPPGTYSALTSYSGDGSHLTYQEYRYAGLANFRVIGPPANFSYPGCYRGQYCASHYPICTYGACSNLGLSAEVTDSAGFGLQGVTVNFSGIGLGFTTASAVTNANGIATVYFTPLQAGSLVVTASVTGIETPLAILITVLPVPLTVLTGAPERYYGTPNPTLVSRIFGLIGSDTVTVNLQTTATQASPVGNYSVTATLSGPDAVNYSPTIQEGFLKVVKGPLNVQARNVVSYYGQTPPPITAYFVEGFVNGDTISVVSGSPVLTTTVTSHTDAGFYKIGVDVSQMSAANYYFNPFGSGEGSVEVIKAPLTVTANNQTMPRGGPVPPLTYTLSGFVNGQDATTAGITGAPLLTTPATSASRPGIYPIYVSNGTFNAKNYWASGVTGVLTITP